MPQRTPGGADYPLPRHNVVLLSCMDLRLINELSEFMDGDNLTNRYDHLVVAGAGLGVVHAEQHPEYQSWSDAFFSHLRIALELHKPEDVYVVEHRCCGAYANLIGAEFDDSEDDRKQERKIHRHYARKVAEKIHTWCQRQPPIDGKPIQLRVSTFLMDLRGRADHLDTFPPEPHAGRSGRGGKRR